MAKAPGAFIDLTIVGTTQSVQSMLDHLDSCFSAEGMASFLHGDVVPWLQQRARNRFAQGGDDASGRWAPLSPVTVKIREGGINRGEWPGISPTHPINVRTHLMENYITRGLGEITQSAGSSALHFPKRTITSAKGMDKKIKTAQVGKSNTSKRPVLAVGQPDLAMVVQSLAYFIQRRGMRA